VRTLGTVVRGLAERGLTMILVEQNFRFVAQLADRHYLIEHGRIVDMITKNEVATRMEALHRFLGV
jgi:branched-chain amino acid transport system ATP-binding protein